MPTRQLLLVASALLHAARAHYGAIPLPAGLSPRQFLGGLEERQAVCASANQHTCLEVNNPNFCCDNTEYCIINNDLSVGCCAIGSNCGISCGSSAYVCTTTVTNSGTATATQACCPRACTSTSQFLCASAQGGGCCPYGYMCTSASGSHGCVSTQAPTSSAVASVIPSGCSAANQFTCASSLGGGCCANGQACVTSGTDKYCSATGSALLTRTGAGGVIATAVSQSQSNGLSTGAKAGIGVGVSLGALAIIGALLWFFLVHRPRARSSATAPPEHPAMSQYSDGQTRPTAERHPSQPSDYFGPAAGAGPFTEDHNSPTMSPGASSRGVPAHPQSPGDIAVPVEIDSRSHSNIGTPSAFDYKKEPRKEPVELP